MITIFKLTIANIRQKKFRTILIILSIILSVALMYSILTMSSSVTDVFLKIMNKETGNAQIEIIPKENSGEMYLPELSFQKMEGMDYHIPLLSAYGYTRRKDDTVTVSLTGMSRKEFDQVYGLNFVEGKSGNLSDHKVYIGEETAKTYHLFMGDELRVTISGGEHTFVVNGILKDKNNSLSYKLGNLSLLTSRAALGEILGTDSKVSRYLIKGSKDKKDQLIKDLEASFSDYDIKNLTDMGDYQQYINMIVTSLFLMVMAVIMVSAFIIYSSFKIISIERMPLMGTLRSIGATRRMTVRTLIYESAIYGLIGGMIGDVLGVGILSAAMNMMLNNYGISVENMSYFNIRYLAVSFIIGIVLAIGSSLIPIVKISRKSIKSIIFSENINDKHWSIYKSVIGVILVGIAFILFYHAPIQLRLALDITGILLITVGGALIIPMIAIILTKLLSLLLKPIFKDGMGVVTANIKNDRTMLNNIMLLAMGFSVIFMINNFSSAISSVVTDVYADCKADALVFSNIDEKFVEEVRKVDGVEHVYTTKEVTNIKANNGKITLMYIDGNDGGGYCKYGWDEFGRYLTDDLIEKYKNERSIIISRFTARKYDLSKGDILKLKFENKEADYKIIAIVPSMINNGNMSFVYEKYLEADAGVHNYQSMYLNFDHKADADRILKKIKALVSYSILPIQTLDDMRLENIKNNNAFIFMMKAISIIAMFIGAVGILNNFTISFLSRKKLTATMRSLGLSQAKTIQNMMYEAFVCGLLGTLSGLALGTLLFKAMCFVIDAMGVPSDVFYCNMKDYLFVLFSGIILSLASAVFPAVSTAKENIVNGLKYE